MLYFISPCYFTRVSANTYRRKIIEIKRIYYSVQKPLPKPSEGTSDFSVTANELPVSKNVECMQIINTQNNPPVKLLDQDDIKWINRKEKWREIKVDYSKLGKYCMSLSKFRLTSLVVITSAVGYALPAAPFDPLTFLCCTVGTGLVSSAANSINQFLEIPFDAQMSRTRNRVLVQGQLRPIHAIGFAAATSSVGLLILYYGTNPLTAALGAANLILYTSIYTPLKRISILNTWVGSIVGAIPPLMGWAACQGSLDCSSLIIGGILYSWQFPHFNALSWNLRPDYSKAGYRMMAVTNPDLCRRTAITHSVSIVGLSSLASVLDLTHWSFAILSLPLNLYFCYLACKFYKDSDSKTSRKLFRFSLLHLPILLTLMLVMKKHWGFLSSSEASAESVTRKENVQKKEMKIFPVVIDSL
ncbi:UNVERIFIED_CONTAM: hypothetical protein PYX00_005260 [Menopon gallinae]|uniref:Protoheme IX farnesyltransferase, mitochondrial n=1 Tax=Menopon gallinae TaxID=328185 RepID=A0AAW2HQL4_9NEOP